MNLYSNSNNLIAKLENQIDRFTDKIRRKQIKNKHFQTRLLECRLQNEERSGAHCFFTFKFLPVNTQIFQIFSFFVYKCDFDKMSQSEMINRNPKQFKRRRDPDIVTQTSNQVGFVHNEYTVTVFTNFSSTPLDPTFLKNITVPTTFGSKPDFAPSINESDTHAESKSAVAPSTRTTPTFFESNHGLPREGRQRRRLSRRVLLRG